MFIFEELTEEQAKKFKDEQAEKLKDEQIK